MTRMTGSDCAVMCNLINTHTHKKKEDTHTHTPPHATPPQAYPYRYVKQHQLTAEDVNLLSRPFPFITEAEEVTSKLMAEKDE